MKLTSVMKRVPLWLVFILAPFLLLSPVLFTGKALFWGTPALQFVPWHSYAFDVLLQGHLPLWNPLVGMGAPLLANYQSALLYPPNWLLIGFYAAGGAPWLAWAHSLLVALHLAWAAIGMGRLAKTLGWTRTAQMISGLAFGLSGYLVARSGFFSINATVAWLPWVILAVESAIQRENEAGSAWIRNWLRGAPPVAMSILAGHAQTTWYSLLLAIGWILWRLVSSRPLGLDNSGESHPRQASQSILKVLRTIGGIGILYILAAGIAAIQILPTAEYLQQSQRATALDFDYAMTYSYWPWRLLTLLAPGMYGSPVTGNYWGFGNFWEDHLYIGLLPLVLAILGAASGFKRRKGDRGLQSQPGLSRFLVALIIISLLLALGDRTPIFPWLYEHVPTFSLFQAPTRWSLWAEFSLALLAGLGAHQLERPAGKGLYWSRLATAGAFAVTLGAGLAWLLLGTVSPTFISSSALAGIFGVATGLLILIAPVNNPQPTRGLSPTQWNWLVGGFVILDLLVAGWGLNPGINRSFYAGRSSLATQLTPSLGERRLLVLQDDEYELKFYRFFRFDRFEAGEPWEYLRAVGLPNLTMLDQIYSANNFDPFVPGRYAAWMSALNNQWDTLNEATRTAILNQMNVGAVESMAPGVNSGVQFEWIMGGALSKWVPCAITISDRPDGMNEMLEQATKFDHNVFIDEGEVPKNTDCGETGHALVTERDLSDPGRVVVSLNESKPGWIVLSQAYYPGWVAMVDGEEIDISPANGAFSAVAVGSDVDQVTFEYRPISFYTGTMVSMASLVGFIIIVFGLGRRKQTSISSEGDRNRI